MRVLLAVDQDGEQLFEGDPVLLVEQRPGTTGGLEVDGADAVPAAAIAHVLSVATELEALVEAAFDREGAFQRELLLGKHVELPGPVDLFES